MPSIGQENLETVMIDFFGALRRGDFEAAAGLLDPGVSWQGLREEWVCHGREEVLDTFRWGLEQRREIDALEFTRGGEHVVLGARGPNIGPEEEPLGQIFNVFTLRDGRATEISCGGGRDTVTADPRDVLDIDCEKAAVAPQPGGAKLTVATLPFPFPGVNDSGRGTIAVEPTLPLHGGAIVLRVSCPAGLGLLELVRAAPCSGRVRFTRGDGVAMGTQRVRVPRGGTISVRLALHQSRALARRYVGLSVNATALPDRGSVQRTLKFRVRG